MTTTSKRAATAAPPGTRAQAMREGRHADSARRRQRVTAALDRATAQGAEINVSAIARAALLTELGQEFLQFSG